MSDPGLAAERTALAHRRTTLPFLVVALLGARAALDSPLPGLVVTLLACVGAAVVRGRSVNALTAVVLLLAAAALLLPPGTR